MTSTTSNTLTNQNNSNPPLQPTPLLNQSSSSIDDDSVYVLPKTYNGKTVTQLFPEFQYDSVIKPQKPPKLYLSYLNKTSSK